MQTFIYEISNSTCSVSACLYTHTHTHTHIYIYIYIYIYINVSVNNQQNVPASSSVQDLNVRYNHYIQTANVNF